MQANLLWHTQRANALFNTINTNIGPGGKINIYTGTMPNAASITNGFVAAAYASSLLLTYSTAVNPIMSRTTDNNLRLFLSVIPNAVNATASGAATWFAMFNPTTITYAMLGDVSDLNGTAPMKFATTTIVSGTSYQIYSLAFQFHQ